MTETKEQFIERYCRETKTTWEKLSKYKVVLPCHCEEVDGPHWAMVQNDPDVIADHMRLYGGIDGDEST